MRKTIFGNTIIENITDDLGLVEEFQEAGDDIYAIVRLDEEEPSGKCYFEIMHNEDGEMITSSEPIFDDWDDARQYLKGYGVNDIQDG